MFGVFHCQHLLLSNILRYPNELELYAQICIPSIDNITVIQMNSLKLRNLFVSSQYILLNINGSRIIIWTLLSLNLSLTPSDLLNYEVQ